jgi:hypothetical protein
MDTIDGTPSDPVSLFVPGVGFLVMCVSTVSCHARPVAAESQPLAIGQSVPASLLTYSEQ